MTKGERGERPPASLHHGGQAQQDGEALGDSGERRVDQQEAELCTAVRGEKTKQTAVNKVQLPRHFISIVCIVLFVLCSASPSLPCGVPVPSHAQLPSAPDHPPRVRPLPSPARLCSVQLPALPVDRTRNCSTETTPLPDEKFSLIRRIE